MANRILYYLQAPTWDLPDSPKSPLQLGNVVTSPQTPEKPIYRAPIPEPLTGRQEGFEYNNEKLQAGRFGLFARFLSLLGFGIDASVSRVRGDITYCRSDELETTQFFPDLAYLETCILAEPVRRYLERTHYRRPIYIVTGIKVVSGAVMQTVRERAIEVDVSPEVDATLWTGVPVGGGLGVGATRNNTREVRWTGQTDFILAYRLMKVVAKRNFGVTEYKDYTKGAFLSTEGDQVETPKPDIESQENMNELLAGFKEVEMTGVSNGGNEGGERVFYAVPTGMIA